MKSLNALIISLIFIPCGAGFAESAVTLAELQGAVIHAQMRRLQDGLDNGRPFQNWAESELTITVTSPNTVAVVSADKAEQRSGIGSSKPRSGTFTIGNPREISGDLTGHRLWLFEDGKMITLGTYYGGGFKITISFSRGSDGLHCTARMTFPREKGVSGWHWVSPITGGVIQMKKLTPTGSSCTVAGGRGT